MGYGGIGPAGRRDIAMQIRQFRKELGELEKEVVKKKVYEQDRIEIQTRLSKAEDEIKECKKCLKV